MSRKGPRSAESAPISIPKIARFCISLCKNVFFGEGIYTLSPAPVGPFSRSRVRRTQRARLYTTAQVWVPGGLRGACSGR